MDVCTPKSFTFILTPVLVFKIPDICPGTLRGLSFSNFFFHTYVLKPLSETPLPFLHILPISLPNDAGSSFPSLLPTGACPGLSICICGCSPEALMYCWRFFGSINCPPPTVNARSSQVFKEPFLVLPYAVTIPDPFLFTVSTRYWHVFTCFFELHLTPLLEFRSQIFLPRTP